jgi:hypothetical protein
LEVINIYTGHTLKYIERDRNEREKKNINHTKKYRQHSESNLNSAKTEKKKSEKNSSVKYEALPVAAI